MRCLRGALAALALLCAPASADDINVGRLWFAPAAGGGAAVNADIALRLNDTLRLALDGGRRLHFVLELHIFAERRYWFDRHIGDAAWRFTLEYDALAGRYRVRGGGGAADGFADLDSALVRLGKVRDLEIPSAAISQALANADDALRAAARFELDVGKLPPPLQVEMLADAEWAFSSGWIIAPPEIEE
jgi:hypothetical protein